jgi:hypothetical protein
MISDTIFAGRYIAMGSCCAKPIATIIKVGNSEAGIRGLKQILTNAQSSGITDEEKLKTELLALARDNGNYVAASVEQAYKEALLREYKEFNKRGG